MASIQERPRADGTVAYRVNFRVNRSRVGDTFDTLEGAEEMQRLVERHGPERARAILRARNSDNRTVILRDWLTDHINRLTGVTDGTRKDYRAMAARHIDPSLGDFPLEALDRRRLEEWVNTLTPTLSGKTLRNVHALLSAALNRAVYDGLIPANLAKGVRLPKPDHNKVEMVTLTQNEITQLVAAFPERWQPLVETMCGTGMRFGEITALPVGACDLDDQPPTVRVRQAWKRTGLSERELGPPKTTMGRRLIPISRQLAERLRPLVDGRPADALVFTSPNGAAVDHAHFHERVWTPALASSKLTKQPRIHDLRHSYATYMAKRVPLDYLQRLLGHESISTTVGVYGHARPGDAAGAARAVEEMLSGALPVIEASIPGSQSAIAGRWPRPE